MIEPKECPFCGHVGVTCSETSTYRWGAAACNQCGAVGPEVRKNISGTDRPDWHNLAIGEWNNRVRLVEVGE